MDNIEDTVTGRQDDLEGNQHNYGQDAQTWTEHRADDAQRGARNLGNDVERGARNLGNDIDRKLD